MTVTKAITSSILIFLVLIGGCACTPQYQNSSKILSSAYIHEKSFHTADNTMLPIRAWLPKEQINSVLIALHGFNDYSNFFNSPGHFLKTVGILSYAYDQRGFASTKTRGFWSGTETYVGDLISFTNLIKKRHPGIPIYILGESMGGAITMLAMTNKNAPKINGIILSAPAVWGRLTMPWYQRIALWVGTRVLPGIRLTGRGLQLKPSDNTKMLLALGRDPNVIKKTRIDTLHGVVNLMDKALISAKKLEVPTLLLYGKKDEIIPIEPTYQMIKTLPVKREEVHSIAIYSDNYHLLLRDLHAEKIWRDIAHWIKAPQMPLPSGADKLGEKLRFQLSQTNNL